MRDHDEAPWKRVAKQTWLTGRNRALKVKEDMQKLKEMRNQAERDALREMDNLGRAIGTGDLKDTLMMPESHFTSPDESNYDPSFAQAGTSISGGAWREMTMKEARERFPGASAQAELAMIYSQPGMTGGPGTPPPSGPDLVNHPPHYMSHPSGVECIQITEHMNFCLGNALKYLWRAGQKDGQTSHQDLLKAIWYIKREIQRTGGAI